MSLSKDVLITKHVVSVLEHNYDASSTAFYGRVSNVLRICCVDTPITKLHSEFSVCCFCVGFLIGFLLFEFYEFKYCHSYDCGGSISYIIIIQESR